MQYQFSLPWLDINTFQFAPALVGVLAVLMFASPPAYGQQADLPFAPDSIYAMVTGTAEAMIEGHAIPTQLAAEAWQADLDTLAARIDRRVPYAAAATGGHPFYQRLDALKRAVPEQTRDQRLLSVLRLLNFPTPGNQHTNADPRQRAFGWRAFPLDVYRFADGVYILRAADSTLIGKELISIGGTPVDSVYAALAPYSRSDGVGRPHYVEGWLMEFANPLRAVGIIDRIDRVPVSVRNSDGTIHQTAVQTMPYDSAAFARYIATAPPPVSEPRPWTPAPSYHDVNEPLYRIEYRDSTNLLYVDFNAVANQSATNTTADLVDRLRMMADDRPIDTFVLDLRTNTGGSKRFAEPLIELMSTHPKINRRGTLYTLISWKTFSAAGLMAMELERRTKTLFAGTRSSFAPNIWGETAPILLPNSKVTAELSYAYYQGGMPGEPRPYLEPDLPVPLTSSQYFQNVDSTLIAVEQHEPAPRETVPLSPADEERFAGTYRLSPIHRVEITEAGEGLRLRIDRGETEAFVESDLYPLSPQRLATDITDVYVHDVLLECDGSVESGCEPGTLTLAWKDTTYTLTPVRSAMTLPLEHIRAGRWEQGAAGLRDALADGMMLGNDFTEYPMTGLVDSPLPIWPDTLSREERARRALPFARLATTFSPMSWRTYANLAWVCKTLGRTEEMRRAAQHAVRLHPIQGANFVRRYTPLSVMPDGTVR